MKAYLYILGLYIFISASIISCDDSGVEPVNNSVFKIAFSDSGEISDNEIQYYDSTTHLLYLNKNIEVSTSSIIGFSVLVNTDTIYQGITYSCLLSSPPRSTFYISDCFHYGQNILELGYYPYSADLRNDEKIISNFKNKDALLNGISCTIDSIKVNSFTDYSQVNCTYTVTNNDLFSYYILDPAKMGYLDFTYYSGGLSFYNIDTKVSSFLKWNVSNSGYETLNMDDFTILNGKSKLTFTFASSDYYLIEPGDYKASFRFCGLNPTVNNLSINQSQGRIWIGTILTQTDNFTVE